jgi:hypothetical protein
MPIFSDDWTQQMHDTALRGLEQPGMNTPADRGRRNPL